MVSTGAAVKIPPSDLVGLLSREAPRADEPGVVLAMEGHFGPARKPLQAVYDLSTTAHPPTAKVGPGRKYDASAPT